jgi:ubiquinone/menaquinone biosynthesis C-methylase UbiE
MLGFSMIADSITLYVQDIDSAVLSKAAFNKIVKRAGRAKKKGANTFYYTIGTAKTTQLPDSLFDKIILISTFHEFTFMDEMMTDIYKKLKPNGKLYILESHCLSHKNYTADETIVMMKKYNFNLVKKDGKNINNSTGLFRMIYKK